MSDDFLRDAPEVEVSNPQEDAQIYVDLVEGVGAEGRQEQEATGETVLSTVEQSSEKEDWEHRYKVLKGKYDKEVPRLHKEIKQLKREKEELYRRLDLLEQMVRTFQAQQQRSDVSVQQVVEEEDDELKRFSEDYPEIYRAMEKLIQKKILKNIEERFNVLQKTVGESQFYAQLTSLVPNWRELNTDPDFLEWLQEPEGDTGFTRHQLMLMAFERGDAVGVARYFKRFIATRQAEAGRGGEVPASKNVSPPHRKTNTSTKEGSKKIYKESEIKEFYRLASLGKIPPNRKAELEADIVQAVLEGRVLYGK